VIGLWTILCGTIFINRQKKDQVGLLVAEISRKLKEGANILLFPEGRATNGERMLPFQTAPLDRKRRQFFYDGKTLTQYGPITGYYASVAAPSTISELVQVLDQKYDLNLPLADLFLWGTDKDGLGDIKSAIYIGPSRIGGIDCDHYVFRQADIDWQIWIERGKTPLPRKLVITTTSEPTQPQYVAVLKWDLAPKLDDKTFTFVPPKGAQKIEQATAAALAAEKKK
jgi:hypothetical protein